MINVVLFRKDEPSGLIAAYVHWLIQKENESLLTTKYVSVSDESVMSSVSDYGADSETSSLFLLGLNIPPSKLCELVTGWRTTTVISNDEGLSLEYIKEYDVWTRGSRILIKPHEEKSTVFIDYNKHLGCLAFNYFFGSTESNLPMDFSKTDLTIWINKLVLGEELTEEFFEQLHSYITKL